MTPSQLDLARRLSERLRGKWRPGMLHAEVNADGELEDFTLIVGVDDRPARGRVPVLDDDATKGALLGMVRNAYRDPGMFARPRGSNPRPDWAVFFGATSDIVCAAPTEGEALALALLEVL